jgi:DNA-binding NarL/FixJ family response regulator
LSENHQIKILLVEDEMFYIDYFKRLLALDGELVHHITVYSAKEIEEALLLQKTVCPDIILLDVYLNSHSSTSTLENLVRFRQQNSRTKICLHSNMQSFMGHQSSKEYHADLFLPKPMTIPTLIKMLKDVVSSHPSF